MRPSLLMLALSLAMACCAGTAWGQTTNWPALIQAAKPAVVWILAETSEGTAAGSGTIISPDGYIVTAAHVVTGASSITIVVNESDEYRASVVRSDTAMDVAVLKIPASGLTWLGLGDSAQVAIEDEIRVLGYPLPGAGVGYIAVAGIIQGTRLRDGTTLLQHNASTAGGHSGGPVVNAEGQVIGVHSAVLTDQPEYHLAVSVNDARTLIPSGVLPTGESPVQSANTDEKTSFAVGDVSISPSPPFISGTEAMLSAWITNTSDVSETLALWLEVGGVRVGDMVLTLVSGERKQTSFRYAFAYPGNYSLRVCTIGGCSDPLDVRVLAPLQTADFSLSNVRVEGSLPLTPGTRATVFASVFNSGDYAGTTRVWLEVAGETIGEVSVSLAAHELGWVSFALPALEPGVFTLVVHTVGDTLETAVAVSSNELVRVLRGTGGLRALAFSPRGELLAVCGSDNAAVEIWSVGTGTLALTLTIPEGPSSIAFSPDGRILAVGSGDNLVRLWDVGSGALLGRLGGDGPAEIVGDDNYMSVTSVAFSADGSVLASGSGDKTARLWDLRSGETTLVVSHDKAVTSVALSADGTLLATGAEDATVRIWDVATGDLVRILTGHKWAVYSVAFSPNGPLLASGGGNGDVKLWDVMAGNLLNAYTTGEGHSVGAIAFSPNGETLAAATVFGYVALVDIATGRFDSRSGDAGVVAFSPDGRSLATGDDYHSTRVMIWNVATDTLVRTLSGPGSGVSSVAFSPDGNLLAGSAWRAYLWDANTGSLLPQCYEWQPSGAGVSRVAFSPGGRLLVLAEDWGFQFRDVVTGALVSSLAADPSEVLSLAFAPNGKTLASGTGGTVKLWSISAGAVIRTLAEESGLCLAFSPDGRILACGHYGGFTLWNIATGTALPSAATGSVYSLAFSADGGNLATCSDDGVTVWDTATGSAVHFPTADVGERVRSVAFAPNGRVCTQR
jgi:WD40 repeat protein/V8-like Glu-specific endopeptidase